MGSSSYTTTVSCTSPHPLQERKRVVVDGLRVRRLTGSDIKPEDWDHFYQFYLNTSNRKWGQP